MKKNIAIALIASAFILGGCSSKSVPMSVKDQDITSNKEKAHFIFSRPSGLLTAAGGLDEYIMEFNPITFEPKLIAISAHSGKSIYSVEEGEHYIYVGFESDYGNVLVVKASKGNTYHIDTDYHYTGAFIPPHPILLEENRLAIKSELEKSPCSKKTLNQYLFNPTNKSEGITKTYSSPAHFTIQCDNGHITNVKDDYYTNSIKELDAPKTVTPSEKSIREFSEDKTKFQNYIKRNFALWEAKFKDLPLSEDPFLVVDKQISNDYIGKFDAVQLVDITINKNIDKEFLTEMSKDLSKEFELESKGAKTLHINLMVNNYDSGSMVGRYFASPFSDPRNDFAVIDVSVIFTDENNIEIGKIRITEVEAGGILGGVNTLKSDVISVIAEYTRKNLLKKN
jgi:hypothetical protein